MPKQEMRTVMGVLTAIVVALGLLVFSSPLLAQLPPGIEADRLFARAERQIEAEDYAAAIATLEECLALQQEHALETPAAFWFRRAQALRQLERAAEAAESSIRYLAAAGPEAEHYAEALSLLEGGATVEQVSAIQEEHGLEIPAAFWFRHAQALQEAGRRFEAIESAIRYMRLAGPESEHYWGALSVLATGVAFDHFLVMQDAHDFEVPVAFWFRYAEWLQESERASEARESAFRYLTLAGSEEQHYGAALRLLAMDHAFDEVAALHDKHCLGSAFWFSYGWASHEAERYGQAVNAVTRYLVEVGSDGEQYAAALELLDMAEQGEAAREAAAMQMAQAAALAAGGASAKDLPFQECRRCPEMVAIPVGSFRMGCVSVLDCDDDELPVHTVTITQPFALSKYEVTFGQWDACVAAGGCGGFRPHDGVWGTSDRIEDRGSFPVLNVSWEDAQAYVSWLSRVTGERYRLPSESEWEYAARAGSETRFSWGNEIGTNRANCGIDFDDDGCDDSYNSVAPVGSFAPNAFGLHDMHGNVAEWVKDCWTGSYRGAPSDGSAWLSGDCDQRVFRGGNFIGLPWFMRSAARMSSGLGYRGGSGSGQLGFRVARTLTP